MDIHFFEPEIQFFLISGKGRVVDECFRKLKGGGYRP